jgi:glycosyltransferase involved in cell wall biosynthesis
MTSISILYHFVDGPWGGVNQFLKALKKELEIKGSYVKDLYKSDVVLFNSYPFRSEYYFDQVNYLKKYYPQSIVILRLDGPFSSVRGQDRELDHIIKMFNRLFVDGIIFQSDWSKRLNNDDFGITSHYETVIHNAPDNTIFYSNASHEISKTGKIRLIASSWSNNWRKGFDIYKFLDDNLDFNKYEMKFIGNSPVHFSNIIHLGPLHPEKLAEVLREHDIYIFSSREEACSNSLIEALSCGLPSVVMNSSGNPEIAAQGGALFNGKEDVIEKIEMVANNYHHYRSLIHDFSITDVARGYSEFALKIVNDVRNGQYKPKRVTMGTKINFRAMKFMILKWKILKRIKSLWKRQTGFFS